MAEAEADGAWARQDGSHNLLVQVVGTGNQVRIGPDAAHLALDRRHRRPLT